MSKPKYIIPSLLLIHLVVLGVFAAYRIVDADEGVYLSAARMVGLGLSPYTDFFYTQLPMMPTIFAPFADNGWLSFFALRGFAVLAGFLSAILLMMIVLKTTRSYISTIIALLMYTFSGMIVVWHSTYKALPFCHFLALGTFFFWLLYSEKRSLLYLILTGLFLSALVNFRSVFIILLPLYLISMVHLSGGKRVRDLMIFTLSLIPLAVPTFMRILESADHFFYGNLFFQIYRDADSSIGHIISNRLVTFFKAAIDPHLFIIFILTIISLLFLIRQKKIASPKDMVVRPEGMAVMNLVLIAVVYLLPHPMSRQYIEQYLAFSIIIIAFNLETMLLNLSRLRLMYRKLTIIIVAALYLVSLIPYVAIFIWGVRKNDRRFLLSEIREVTNQMLTLATESDTVLAEWAGYPFLTRQTPLRYTEILGSEYALPLEHEEYMKYKLCDHVFLREAIRRKEPGLVVTVYKPPEYYADLLKENYGKAFQADVVSIYKRK